MASRTVTPRPRAWNRAARSVGWACLCVRDRRDVDASATTTTLWTPDKGELPFGSVSRGIGLLARFQGEYAGSQRWVERRWSMGAKPVRYGCVRNRFRIAIQGVIEAVLGRVSGRGIRERCYSNDVSGAGGVFRPVSGKAQGVPSERAPRRADARSTHSPTRTNPDHSSSDGVNRSGSSCANVETRSSPRSRTCVRISPFRTAASSMSWVCESSVS